MVNQTEHMIVTPYTFAWLNRKLRALGARIVTIACSPYANAKASSALSSFNETTSTRKVATPVISPASTGFAVSLQVTITCNYPGVTIKYSVDGSDPNVAGITYVSPLLILDTTTFKARGYVTGDITSDMASATYTLL